MGALAHLLTAHAHLVVQRDIVHADAMRGMLLAWYRPELGELHVHPDVTAEQLETIVESYVAAGVLDASPSTVPELSIHDR